LHLSSMSQASYEDIATNTDVIPTQKDMQDLMIILVSLKAQIDHLTAAMEARSPSSPMPSASVPYPNVTGLHAIPLCDSTSVPTIPILTQLSVREVLIWQEGLTTLDFQHFPMPVDPVHYVQKSVLTSALNKLGRSTISAASAFSIHYNSHNIHKIDANNLNLLLFHTLAPTSKTEFKALFNSSIRFKPLEEAFQPQQLYLATLLDATLSYLKDVSLFHRFLTQGCTTPAQELELDYLPLMTDTKQGYISMVLDQIPHDYGSTLLNLLDPAVLKRTRFLEDFLNLLRQEINDIYPTVQAKQRPHSLCLTCTVEDTSVATPDQISAPTPDQISVATPDQISVATPDQISVATSDQISVATSDQISVATPDQISVATPDQISVATPTRTAAKDQVPRDAPQLPRGVTKMARDPSSHSSDSNKYQLSSNTNINAIWLQDPYEHHDSSSQYLMWHHPQSFVPTGLMVTIPKAAVIYCPVPTYMYRPHTNLHTPSIGRLTNSLHVLEDTYSVDPSFFPLSPQPHDTTLPWSSPLELAPEEIDTPLPSNHPNLLELPAKPNIPDSLRSRCRPVPPFCTTYVPHAAIRLFHLHNYVRVKNRTN
jgi:hypothetical protein